MKYTDSQLVEFAMRLRDTPWTEMGGRDLPVKLGLPKKRVSKLLGLLRKKEFARMLAIVDFYRLGFIPYLLSVNVKDPRFLDEVGQKLLQTRFLGRWYFFGLGDPSFLALLRIPKSVDVSNFMDTEVFAKFGDSISGARLEPVYRVFFGGTAGTFPPEDNKILSVDVKDLMMLRALRNDAFVRLADLARIIGLSEPSTWLRLKKLRSNKILQGFMGLLNLPNIPSKERQIRLVLLLRLDPGRISGFVKDLTAVRGEPSPPRKSLSGGSGVEDRAKIVVACGLYGEYNVFAEMRADSDKDAYEFITNLIKKYNIQNIRTFVTLRMSSIDFPHGIID